MKGYCNISEDEHDLFRNCVLRQNQKMTVLPQVLFYRNDHLDEACDGVSINIHKRMNGMNHQYFRNLKQKFLKILLAC